MACRVPAWNFKTSLDWMLTWSCSATGMRRLMVFIGNHLFNQVLEFSYTWSGKTVKPLRQIRSWLKDDGCTQHGLDSDICMNYRDKIKAMELEAEKMQQITLESFCQAITRADISDQQSSDAAAQNLKIYLTAENIQITNELINELEFINKASFENSDSRAFSKILIQ